jgi:hypothetical protein
VSALSNASRAGIARSSGRSSRLEAPNGFPGRDRRYDARLEQKDAATVDKLLGGLYILLALTVLVSLFGIRRAISSTSPRLPDSGTRSTARSRPQ